MIEFRPTPPSARRSIRGVTLLELMIAITILGALVAIAVPAYRGYAERAQRTLAKDALLSLQAAQENWYLQNNTYTANLTSLGFPGGCSDWCVYTLDFTVAPDTLGYTARARPTVGGGTNGVNQTTDTDCQWFTVTSTGVVDAGPDPGDRCWP